MQTTDLLLLLANVTGVAIHECPARGCRRWFTQRRITQQRVGIYMHEQWYCSSSCFQRAVEMRLSQLLPAAGKFISHMPRMPIGLLLLSRGLLSSSDLQGSVLEQKRTGRDLGELLISRGLLSAKELTAARASQWDCPVFAMPRNAVISSIRIPETIAEGHSMVPLHYVAATNTLLVGFVQSVEYGPLYTIERIIGCKTQACFVTREEFTFQMGQGAISSGGDPSLSELVFEGIESPVELSRIVANYSSSFKAEHVSIDICRHYLWVRLKNGPRAIDLLFKISQ